MIKRLALGFLLCLFLVAPTVLRAQEQESVRVATFNAYLLSPIFKCGNPQFADCLLQINGETEAQANHLADTILKDTNRFDIIAINEAWDEDAKQILVDRLKQKYPNYIGKIDADLIKLRGATLQAVLNGMSPAAAVAIYGLPIEKINGEDSGLMFFANADFKFLPLPDQSFKWGDDQGESLDAQTPEVGFTLFEPCGGFDCLSGKGAAIVRLRHEPSQSNYTVVFSHMQADYFDKDPPEINTAAREGQFAQAEKLIETTLSPLSPSQRRRERVLMMGDLNVPLFHQPGGEWAGRFANPGTYWTDNFYDAWAATGSTADPGISNYVDGERYDYILASPSRYETGGIEGPICVQHMTVPVDFQDLESDHNMVAADLNLGNDFCHPQIAYRVALKKTKVNGKPREQELIDHVGGTNVTEIRYPGSMQWFHVVRPDAGTYSIGPDRPDMNMDIYLPDNLTTPISRYYGDTKVIAEDERKVFVQTFVLPREFYIRMSGKDRFFTGDYALLIRRHTCATKEEACLLQPGEAPGMATLTAAGSLFGTQDEAWFGFDVVGAADSGAYQTVKLAAEGLPDPDNFKVTLEDFVNTNGSGPPPVEDKGTSRKFTDQMGPGSTGYLVIRQTSAGTADVPVWAFMETTVRNLELKALICEDETNPELGSDDIYTELTIDTQTTRFPAGGELEYDCDDSADHKDWPNHFGTANLTFVNHAGLKVIEEDDSSPNDPSRFNDFPDLPSGVTVIDGVKAPLIWRFEGGRYRLNYELRLRRNQPVKAAP
ncbi:MAG: hypothetical protein E5W82_24035 [Mesorhizobium sp.]|nr:MAG: hypothetical protein E5W82_24035 [Mesorhizobium sp.]